MKRNLTTGPIGSSMIAFTLPLMLGGLLQQLYNWADALIVGNYLGEAALAAVGSTASFVNLLLSLISGFMVGVSILVARAYGADDQNTVRRTLWMFVVLMGSLSLVLAVVGVLLTSQALVWLGTPADIEALAGTYLRIVMLGIPFMAIYNVYNAVLRGIGDSKAPLMAIVLSSLCNIGLTLFFVNNLGLGVGGAAWATIASQAAMAIYVILYAWYRYPRLRVDLLSEIRQRTLFEKPLLYSGLRMSLPTAIQAIMRQFGNVLLQNIMNSFGSTTVVAITSAYRIDTIGILPVSNLGTGISTFTAQNHGAKQYGRMRRGLTIGLGLSLGVAFAITAAMVLVSADLLGIFGLSPETITIGHNFLVRLAAFYPIYALQNALSGYLSGLGDVAFTSSVSIATLALRIIYSFVMAPYQGNMVVAYAESVAWCFHLVLVVARVWMWWQKWKREGVSVTDVQTI